MHYSFKPLSRRAAHILGTQRDSLATEPSLETTQETTTRIPRWRNSYIPDISAEQIDKMITGLIRHLTLEKENAGGERVKPKGW